MNDFSTHSQCVEYLERVRWQGKPICPHCNARKSTPMIRERRHHCNSCHITFSVTVGTIFYDTRLPLNTWFLAIAIILSEQDIAARELSRRAKINKNTACRIMAKVFEAMATTHDRQLLLGIVSAQEQEQ